MRAVTTIVLCAATALAGLGVFTLAFGPLDPPAGPISPTSKTLTQIEPRTAVNATNTPGDAASLYRITQPGSYYLTGNVVGVAGMKGIEIAADAVCLDLNGFAMVGPGAGPPGGTFDAVFASGAAPRGITVRNGAISDWDGLAVDLGSASTECRLENLRVHAAMGLWTGDLARVTACEVDQAPVGIRVGERSVLRSCVVRQAAAGFRAGASSRIEDCTSASNTNDGFQVGAGCQLVRCTATANAGMGITASEGSTLVDCVVSGSGSPLTGVGVGAGSLVLRCTISGSAGHGISVHNTTTVRDCRFSGNGTAGTGAGIYIHGPDCRVESNISTGNDIGIYAVWPGNFIARNRCTGNTTNWDLVGGNICLVINAAAAGAVSGNTGGAAPGSTDPLANFTY